MTRKKIDFHFISTDMSNERIGKTQKTKGHPFVNSVCKRGRVSRVLDESEWFHVSPLIS